MSTAELAVIIQRLDRLEALFINLVDKVNMEDIPYLLGQSDMEHLLRCKRSYIHTLIENSILPKPYKIGGKNLWKRSEVLPAIDKAMEMNQE